MNNSGHEFRTTKKEKTTGEDPKRPPTTQGRHIGTNRDSIRLPAARRNDAKEKTHPNGEATNALRQNTNNVQNANAHKLRDTRAQRNREAEDAPAASKTNGKKRTTSATAKIGRRRSKEESPTRKHPNAGTSNTLGAPQTGMGRMGAIATANFGCEQHKQKTTPEETQQKKRQHKQRRQHE